MPLRARALPPTPAALPRLPSSPLAAPEIYRQLYAALHLPVESSPLIGITSAIAGEGRSTIALGLARTLARDLDALVWLVEADLEHPQLAQQFEMPLERGLAEVIRGECELSAVRALVEPNLCVVPAGQTGGDAAGLLHQLAGSEVLQEERGEGSVMIVDLPPLLSSGYSPLVARLADEILLVVRAGVTPLAVVREAIARLDGSRPAGMVFNAARSSSLPFWSSSRRTTSL